MAPKIIFVISKIIAYIDKVNTYTKGLQKEEFLANFQLLEACAFSLLQMGELVGQLDNEFRILHPEIPWVKIRGLRNRLVHDYEGVNQNLIWDIVNNDLSPLREQLVALGHSFD